MKKISIIVGIIVILIAGLWLIIKPGSKTTENSANKTSQCEVKEITFYYLDQCGWCQKVKKEGTIEKIEQLGIKVNKINAAIGPIRHQFEGVPTFAINEKTYSGYRTFEEIKELLNCPLEEKNLLQNENQAQTQVQAQKDFLGEKGESVALENQEVKLNAAQFSDNQTKFFNVKMPDGKTIYFFVVKDKNGIYRTAANACQVCYGERKGFRQEGNEIICNNCGNRYPIEKIATEKGGCNPGPINPNLEVKDGNIVIKQADIEQVSELF